LLKLFIYVQLWDSNKLGILITKDKRIQESDLRKINVWSWVEKKEGGWLRRKKNARRKMGRKGKYVGA
jgi:hypothetical protein